MLTPDGSSVVVTVTVIVVGAGQDVTTGEMGLVVGATGAAVVTG